MTTPKDRGRAAGAFPRAISEGEPKAVALGSVAALPTGEASSPSDESGHGRDVAAQSGPPLSPVLSGDSGGLSTDSPELFSVRSDLHPQPGPDDLADALENVRIAGAALLLEMYVPLPTNTRHLATVLTRRAVAGADYASQLRQAAFLADHLADRELEE